jgi:hypothetical protein
MKSLIVIALALTSVASFSATKAATKTEVKTTEVKTVEACANLKGKELTACEAKKDVKAVVATETKAETKAAHNVKAAAATTTTTPAKK